MKSKIALAVIVAIFLLSPSPALGQGGLVNWLVDLIVGQTEKAKKPTLYTEPDHCPPCRQLEAELNARYGPKWREHVNVSRGSPSGYVPYITDANGQKIEQGQLFSSLDQAIRQGGGRQPPSKPPAKPPAKSPVRPPPPATQWTPVRPPAGNDQIWEPAGPVLRKLVSDAGLKAADSHPIKLDWKEIKISADGEKLTFKFCELDKNGNEKNCRVVEIIIPQISDLQTYKRFVKGLEDVFAGKPIPPELKPKTQEPMPPLSPQKPPAKVQPPPPKRGLPDPNEAPKPKRVIHAR